MVLIKHKLEVRVGQEGGMLLTIPDFNLGVLKELYLRLRVSQKRISTQKR
jgi:hypothetical protein